MSDAPDEIPRFYGSKSAWPVEVRKYVHHLCYERQREIQGTDGGILEWLFRGREGIRAMASAHVIPDDPVDGAMLWLWRTIQKFDVVIFSTRCRTWRGRRAVRRWLRTHGDGLYYEMGGALGLEDIKLSYKKIPALVYLDDRAMRFEGTFPTAAQIHASRPWNKITIPPKSEA